MLALIVLATLLFILFAADETASKAIEPGMIEPVATSTQPAPAVAPRSIVAALSQEEIVNLIIATAIRYGINKERFLGTARCESTIRPRIVGDDGASYGLWQIHLKSHPSVKKEQAFDPVWSTEWAAAKFKKDPTIWTCYRNLYGTSERTATSTAHR